MAPVLSSHDKAYGHRGNMKLFRNAPLLNALLGKAAYLSHLIVCQLSVLVTCALREVGSILRYGVLEIVRLSTQPQVSRVAASGRIATMAYEHTIWDRADKELVRKAVGLNSDILVRAVASHTHVPIAVGLSCALPQPASIASVLWQKTQKYFGGGTASVPPVTTQKSLRFATAPTPTVPCLVGYRHFLAAPTLAIPIGRVKSVFCDPGGVFVEVCRKIGLWVMILHVSRSFQRLTMPRDVSASPWRFCCLTTGVV